jgi:hypothetical protein
MSTGMYSISHAFLKQRCTQLITSFDGICRQYSSTDFKRRTEQLQSLIWKFVEFKHRLDTQADRYVFLWYDTGIPFREDVMTNLTGESSVNAVVQYCLAPMLYKIPSGSTEVLVRKAVVTTYGPSVSGG